MVGGFSVSMKKLLENKWLVPVVVFVAIIASRLASTIYYLEDPDSLRFALGAIRFDLVKLQPHFPGYPVFIALVKPIYALLSSFALSFSIIGALSTFIIIWGIKFFVKNQNSTLWLLLLTFFNPLMWLMANRYMPDLLGTAMVFGVFGLLIQINKWKEAKFLLLLLVGLLAGTRLSYLPMVFLPTVYTLFWSGDKLKMWIVLIFSSLVWLAPMVWITGFEELVKAAVTHTDGHFNQWGGAISEGEKYFIRFTETLESLWADGFGAYWWPRSWLTVIVGFGVLGGLVLGVFQQRFKLSFAERMLLWSGFIYLIWIFFYQNVVYKPRHVLPLIPLIIIYLSRGFQRVWESGKVGQVILGVFFVAYISVSLSLVIAHKTPSAVAESAEFLKEKIKPGAFVASTNLVNEYLQAYDLPATFVNIEEGTILMDSLILAGEKVFAVGIFDREFPIIENDKKVFYHNPYVNRMWPKMEVRIFND
ncbi:MAG: hypothetical protein ACI81S_001375 [Sphingobacteriales bacterium]